MIKRRTNTAITFSNNWVIRANEDGEGYDLVNYDEDINANFPSAHTKASPKNISIFKRFIIEEFGYADIFAKDDNKDDNKINRTNNNKANDNKEE